MNIKKRGTSKNRSVSAIKSKPVRLRKKVIQELKDYICKQNEKHTILVERLIT